MVDSLVLLCVADSKVTVFADMGCGASEYAIRELKGVVLAPQLLHEMLPQLKTCIDTLSADDLWIAFRAREGFILNGNGRLGRERGWVTCPR